MKDNFLYKFAIKDLKKHHKDSLLAMITIFVITLIIMSISALSPLIVYKDFIEYQNQYGSYTHYQLDLTYEELESLQSQINHMDQCIISIAGYTLNNEKMLELKGNSDIVSTKLKEGQLPQNENEIALKQSVIKSWGYDKKINDYIALSYITNSKLATINSYEYYSDNAVSHVKDFKIVGILEETGRNDIIVNNMASINYELYLKTDQLPLDLNEHFTTSMTIEDFNANRIFITPRIIAGIEICIIIVAATLLYGLTLSSFENKQKDYSLLRSIGITKRQMYTIIMIQAVLLSFVPIILGTVIVYVIFLSISHIMTLPILPSLKLDDIIFNFLLIALIVNSCYLSPAYSASKKALIGQFVGQEFQYFYYRYKKLHQMRPLYLGWRQLVGIKKKMIIKIFFIALITVSSMNIVSQYVIGQYDKTLISHNQIDITITNTRHSIHKEDFTLLEPYAKSIDFFQYQNINLSDGHFLSTIHVPDEPSETGWYEFDTPRVYCINDALQNEYDIPYLDDNEIAISRGYMNTYDETYQLGDKFKINKEEYEVVYIIDNDMDDLIIVSKDNYQKFGNIDTIQEVMITFDNLQQKTQALLNCPDTFEKILNLYGISASSFHHIYIQDYTSLDNQIYFNSYMIFSSLLILGISMIYIYQFTNELFKQKEDIGTYQLLGFTHKEIFQIYFYKSLIIASFGFIAGAIYYTLDCYYKYHSLSYEHLLWQPHAIFFIGIFTIILIIVIISISLLPLTHILKNDGLQNKYTND